MGLYLCVFRSEAADDEVDGVEVGACDDFHDFRLVVAQGLENGQWGSRFPVLMAHHDSDGRWPAGEAMALAGELQVIGAELAGLPARGFAAGSWQEGVARQLGLAPRTLGECFIDVDGELVPGRLRELALTAAKLGAPVSFQSPARVWAPGGPEAVLAAGAPCTNRWTDAGYPAARRRAIGSSGGMPGPAETPAGGVAREASTRVASRPRASADWRAQGHADRSSDPGV